MEKECWNCKHIHDDSDYCDSCLAAKKPTKWEPGSIYIPDTNADRIRRMTDEELASAMFVGIECGACPCSDKCRKGSFCSDTILKWLKQPAEGSE